MKLSITLIIMLGLLASCNPKKSQQTTEKWSVRMANSILQTSDQLIEFETKNNPSRTYDTKQWDYDVSYLAFAMKKMGGVNQKYASYSDAYFNHFVGDDGVILNHDYEEYNVDKIYPARNLFPLYHETKDEKYKLAIEKLVDQMRLHPKTESGGYWHKIIYPHQMWLDGIFMASPFLVQYGKEFNEPEWFDEVAKQITLVYKKTYDEETGLLYHAQDESKQQKWADPVSGRSSYFWGRAIGWYVMAIVEVMDYFPEDHPQRSEILEIFKNTIDAVLKVRDEKSGVWYQILNLPEREGNYLEGSCTAMFTYAMAKAANLGYLDAEYKELANDCFDSMIKSLVKVEDNGKVVLTNVCGGAGLGGNPYRDGSFEYYISEQIIPNDCKGAAPFIMAAMELNH